MADKNKIIIEVLGDNKSSPVIQKIVSDISQINPAMNLIKNTTMGFTTAIASAFTIGSIVNFGKQLIDANERMLKLKNTFEAITGSSAGADKELNFLFATSNKLGQRATDLGNSYKGLLASMEDTKLAGKGVQMIFTGIAEAGTALRLSNDELNGILLATQQMFSKGTVQAEELRGQLGERLPGAYKLAADAMGVTTQELGKMIQKGDVVATDLIPKLVMGLHEKYGDSIASAANTSTAAINRLNNTLDVLKAKMAQDFGISATFKASLDALNQGFGPNSAIRDLLQQMDAQNDPTKQMDALVQAKKQFPPGAGTFGNITIIDADKIKEQQQKLRDALKTDLSQSRPPWQVWRDDISKFNEALKAGAISESEYNNLRSKSWKDYEASVKKANKTPKLPQALGVNDIDQSLTAFTQRVEDVFQKLNDAKSNFNEELLDQTGDTWAAEAEQIKKWADDSKVQFSQQVQSAQQAYKEIQQRLFSARGGGTPEAFAQLQEAQQRFEQIKNVADDYSAVIDKIAKTKIDRNALMGDLSGRESLAELSDEYQSITGNIQAQTSAQIELLRIEKERSIITAQIPESMKEQYNELLNLIEAEKEQQLNLKATGSFWDGFNFAAKEAARNMETAAQQGADAFSDLKSIVDNTGKDVAASFMDMAISGKSSFADMIESMISKLGELVLYQLAIKPLFDWASGSITSGISGLFAPKAHSGWNVGSESPPGKAFVNPAVFVGAPRLHSGLAPDEFPAILQSGEQVIPRGGSRQPVATPQITINNQTGTPIKAENIKFDGKQWVLNIIAEDFSKGGSIWKMIRSR